MRSRAAIVGAFILGALALAVGGILFFGSMRLFAASSRAVVFFDESLAGLDVGSPVTFHGVRIGSVQSIAVRFATDTMTAWTPVYIEIESPHVIIVGKKFGGSAIEFNELIRAGLRAQLALQSFVTGQLRVDLDFRPDMPVRLIGFVQDVPEIPAISSELGELRNRLAQLPLRELADAAHQALASLGQLSNHLDATLEPLAKSAMRAADTATQTLQTADEAMRRLQADASTALRDVDTLLVDARRQLDSRGGELSRTLTESDRAVHQAEALLESINSLAEPRSAFRGDLEATVRDLAASASSLRSFAETVERNPNALLMGRTNR